MIVDAIKRAQRAHRAVMESMYDGRCSIYGMQTVTDSLTKVTRQTESLMRRDIPCHLSYSGPAPAAGSDTLTMVTQTTKLFLTPEIAVPPGSRIEVTQQGRTECYSQSGKAAVYASHQEILLELWSGYA